MNNWTEEQKQKFARFQEILDTRKQRYIKATGDRRGYRGFKGKDYLTDEQGKEASLLLRQIFVAPSNNIAVPNQEKLQNLPNIRYY